ncbi:uncharacterized protein TM35_001101030, partial [Trypanosoma theileri]
VTLPPTTTNSFSAEETEEKHNIKMIRKKQVVHCPHGPFFLVRGEVRYISIGRFGDPIMGHYQELSDERFRVLPSQEAQEKWAVGCSITPTVLCRINCSGQNYNNRHA